MQRLPIARILLSLLILTGITGLVFSPILRNDFVNWDDQTEIIHNPDFNPVSWPGLGWNWSHTRLSLYMPVTYMTWGAVAEVAGRNDSGTLMPFAFHALNLALHLICAVLVFLLLMMLWRQPWPALVGALVFAVHPLQVEPVAWASGMYTLLSSAFSLGALLAYVAAARLQPSGIRANAAELPSRSKLDTGRGATAFICLATGLYVLALLTKAASVSVPLAAGVIDLLILARPLRRVIRSLWLWFLLAVPIVLVAKHFQDVSQIATPSLWGRPVVALDAIGFYLRKIVLPMSLIPDYGRNPNWVMQHPRAALVSVATAGIALLLAYCARRNAAWITAGIGLLIAGTGPYLGLTAFDFQYVSTVADRYAYFGLIGLALLAGGLVVRSRAASGVLLVALGAWAILSYQQAQRWRDTNTLFNYTLQINPNSLVSHNVFGFIAAQQGRPEEAQAHYLEALKNWPQDATIQFNLGNLYLTPRPGWPARPDLALQHYALALQYQPNLMPNRINYAAALARMGHAEEAYNRLQRVIAEEPDNVDAHNVLGDLLVNLGRLEAAASEYRQVLRIDPKNAHANQRLQQMETPSGK